MPMQQLEIYYWRFSHARTIRLLITITIRFICEIKCQLLNLSQNEIVEAKNKEATSKSANK